MARPPTYLYPDLQHYGRDEDADLNYLDNRCLFEHAREYEFNTKSKLWATAAMVVGLGVGTFVGAFFLRF